MFPDPGKLFFVIFQTELLWHNTIQFYAKTGEKNFNTKVDLLQFIAQDCPILISIKTYPPRRAEMFVPYYGGYIYVHPCRACVVL